MTDLNARYERLVELFVKAGVLSHEARHHSLGYGFGGNDIWLLKHDHHYAQIGESDARDLLDAHFERLWMNLCSSPIGGEFQPVGISWAADKGWGMPCGERVSGVWSTNYIRGATKLDAIEAAMQEVAK